MAKIKKGDRVRQIMPAPVEGVVTEFNVCQENGTVLVKVEWPDTDGDGLPQSRFFNADEVEIVS